MGSETRPATAPPGVGILRPELQEAVVRRAQLPPGELLSTWVEHFWSVEWDLRGRSGFRAEVMAHPSLHVTLETGTEPRFGRVLPVGLVHGVPTRRFTIDLAGAGRTFGVKFRPGGLGAFTGESVGAWSDRVVPLSAAFGEDLLTSRWLAVESDEDRAAVAVAYLAARRPAADPTYDLVLAAVDAMREDPRLTTVEAVAGRFAVSDRTLQRWFRRYVGVGPKWVLRRYRLHDAVSAIDAGEHEDLAGLAVRLGWFDQAHFTREFAALVGQPPAAYAARRGLSAGTSRSGSPDRQS